MLSSAALELSYSFFMLWTSAHANYWLKAQVENGCIHGLLPILPLLEQLLTLERKLPQISGIVS
jgi:hypothetical protein